MKPDCAAKLSIVKSNLEPVFSQEMDHFSLSTSRWPVARRFGGDFTARRSHFEDEAISASVGRRTLAGTQKGQFHLTDGSQQSTGVS
ncbi:unnamed protein product, partial [Mesorhabditis belari]|uniref:Uncharacterized protein n=1 Tax=Mesorhabditis belari TaxID=2138241 RepID=A0AAF3FG74_9BILA